MKRNSTIPAALIAGLILASTGFAAPSKTFESGKSYHSLPAGSGLAAAAINCYNNPSDVCISNQSSQGVNFNVAYPSPSQPVAGPLAPPQWVDAYSTYVFNQVYVTVTNAYGQPIFAQMVGNHSVINITNQAGLTSGQNTGKLKVTVTS